MRIRRPLPALCGAFLAMASAGIAVAVPVDLRDAQGRVIHFDAPDAATAQPYADTLSGLVHGDEISLVRIDIVPAATVTATCGAGTAGCYSASSRGRYTITVPIGSRGPAILVHEYGHHIETSRRTSFSARLSAVPQWRAARGIDALTGAGRVAFDYSLGWERSIPEIFAEDYAQLHAPSGWRMGVPAPTADVLAALRRDLTAQPAAPPPAPAPAPQPPVPNPVAPATPPMRPVPGTLVQPPPAAIAAPSAPAAPTTVSRTGRLRPGRRVEIPFRLDRPGREIVVGVRVAGRRRAAALRASVRCDGRVVGAGNATRRRPMSLRAGANPGPAGCAVALQDASGTLGYRATIRVA